MIVFAPAPEPHPNLIDRYLVAAEHAGLRPLLLLNKADLINDENGPGLHALLEVYRRKKARATEDLLPKLRNRMMAAFEASGLTREAYTGLVLSRDDAANAILEEAFAEWSARNAKDEALLRAFEASGQTLEAFADMYGMVPRTVGQQLELSLIHI